jgi:cell division protein FtsW
LERLLTFINPAIDPLGTSYQIQQSLIAIGSGQFFGRGFGQSIQKFSFLPQPIGDSIFAVAAEELGFIGSIILITLFLALAFRGLRIASHATDYFGGLLVVGIVMLIISQSFINIASMLGVFPLIGLPLSFISHGGSALLFTLAGIGIVLNVSKYQRSKAIEGG